MRNRTMKNNRFVPLFILGFFIAPFHFLSPLQHQDALCRPVALCRSPGAKQPISGRSMQWVDIAEWEWCPKLQLDPILSGPWRTIWNSTGSVHPHVPSLVSSWEGTSQKTCSLWHTAWKLLTPCCGMVHAHNIPYLSISIHIYETVALVSNKGLPLEMTMPPSPDTAAVCLGALTPRPRLRINAWNHNGRGPPETGPRKVGCNSQGVERIGSDMCTLYTIVYCNWF